MLSSRNMRCSSVHCRKAPTALSARSPNGPGKKRGFRLLGLQVDAIDAFQSSVVRHHDSLADGEMGRYLHLLGVAAADSDGTAVCAVAVRVDYENPVAAG